MGEVVARDLLTELAALDINDQLAVRTFAQRLESDEDRTGASEACARSRAVRAAIGRLRAENLAQLLQRDDREAFIRLTADPAYMDPVDVNEMRVPRFLAVERYACTCGVALLLPYPNQGGPGFGFECPACTAPYLAQARYSDNEYRLTVEVDLRPARKRKKRAGVL